MKNPQAFPCHPDTPPEYDGMTLRDYFAAKAMLGMMIDNSRPECDYIAEIAYKMAEAMLKARET